MKKISKYIILTFILLIMAGCSAPVNEDRDVYTILEGGINYTVNTVDKTITAEDGTVFSYKISDSTAYITYPDGSTFWWKIIENGGFGGWSDDYDGGKYVSGETLVKILTAEIPVEKTNDEEPTIAPIFGLAFAAVGILYTVKPHKAWHMNVGWQIKNSEPTENALTYYRLGGIIMTIMGIMMMIM